MPYACIDPQTLDHFCSDYKINPDTGLVRFEAPKTKGPPFPDYDQEESETALHLGKLCDRVYPYGKSEGLGEFGEEYDMGEPREDEEIENESQDEPEPELYREPRDPRRRPEQPEPNRRSILKNNSNNQQQQERRRESDPESGRMAKQGQREVESSRYRRSGFTTKRNTRDSARSPYSKQRSVVYDSVNRRKPRDNYPEDEYDYEYAGDEYADDGADYEIDDNGAYYARERRPYSRRRAIEEQHFRDRRNGFRTVQFKRRRARTRSPQPSYSTAGYGDDDGVIVLDDEPLPHRTKPPSTKQRSVTTFEPVAGTTTTQPSDEEQQSDGSDSSDTAGKPLDDLENFWQC